MRYPSKLRLIVTMKGWRRFRKPYQREFQDLAWFCRPARYFREGVDRKVSGSRDKYGGCLSNGWGLSVDADAASKYFKLGADQGDSYDELDSVYFVEGTAEVCQPMKLKR
jgi:TPR repeat protein